MKKREVWVCRYLQMKVRRMDTLNVVDFLPIFWGMTLIVLFLCLLLSDIELFYKQILSIKANNRHRRIDCLHTVLTGYVLTPVCSHCRRKSGRHLPKPIFTVILKEGSICAWERAKYTLLLFGMFLYIISFSTHL